MTPKIATCCYCGTRAALVLARGRHELSCASCGAPLTTIKMLRTDAPTVHRRIPDRPARRRPPPPKRPRRRFAKLVAKILDEIEDIFD